MVHQHVVIIYLESQQSHYVPTAPNDLLATISFAFQGLSMPIKTGPSSAISSGARYGDGNQDKPGTAFDVLTSAVQENNNFDHLNSRTVSGGSKKSAKLGKRLSTANANKLHARFLNSKISKKIPISMEDYKNYLSLRACDFISNILVPQDDYDTLSGRESRKSNSRSGRSSTADDIMDDDLSENDVEGSTYNDSLDDFGFTIRQEFKQGYWIIEGDEDENGSNNDITGSGQPEHFKSTTNFQEIEAKPDEAVPNAGNANILTVLLPELHAKPTVITPSSSKLDAPPPVLQNQVKIERPKSQEIGNNVDKMSAPLKQMIIKQPQEKKTEGLIADTSSDQRTPNMPKDAIVNKSSKIISAPMAAHAVEKLKGAESPSMGSRLNSPLKRKIKGPSQTLQERLENIWTRLEMPIEQKIDMAIKYSSTAFISNLKQVRRISLLFFNRSSGSHSLGNCG